MRQPPDQKRKAPPQCHLRRGQNRKIICRKQPRCVKSRKQRLAYVPALGSLSLHAAADPCAPIRARVFGLCVAHRIKLGARIDPDDANLLRRLDAARRRQLAALVRPYGVRT